VLFAKEGKECVGCGAKCGGEVGTCVVLEVDEAVNNTGESGVEVVLCGSEGGGGWGRRLGG
jgi:hypothetical protein